MGTSAINSINTTAAAAARVKSLSSDLDGTSQHASIADFTDEQQKLLDKIQTLLSTTKTEYLSPLERLLKIKWDPFESIDEAADLHLVKNSPCPTCGRKPDPETGYPLDPRCLGCSAIVYDTEYSIGASPFWKIVQPLEPADTVTASG